MRRLIISALLLAACATAGDEDIRPFERSRFEAMVRNDLQTLAPMLAEDLVYVHSDGAVETKQQFLERLRSGGIRYRSIEPRDVVARVYDSVAVVTGRSDMGVTMAGADHRLTIRYTSVYRKTETRWQLVSWQSTVIR